MAEVGGSVRSKALSYVRQCACVCVCVCVCGGICGVTIQIRVCLSRFTACRIIRSSGVDHRCGDSTFKAGAGV